MTLLCRMHVNSPTIIPKVEGEKSVWGEYKDWNSLTVGFRYKHIALKGFGDRTD